METSRILIFSWKTCQMKRTKGTRTAYSTVMKKVSMVWEKQEALETVNMQISTGREKIFLSA
jgi:hypothetical protein